MHASIHLPSAGAKGAAQLAPALHALGALARGRSVDRDRPAHEALREIEQLDRRIDGIIDEAAALAHLLPFDLGCGIPLVDPSP
jgi:hypothetical protein